jgi:electron transfer flavoprotein alpha subunit
MSVLVVAEQQSGVWHRMSWEALAAGQQVGRALGQEVTACVAGSGVEGLANDLAAKSVDRVYWLEHELLKAYTPDAYTIVFRALMEKVKPHLVLFPHTYRVRDFGPKLAASLQRPFVSDAIAVRVDGGELVFVRQLFQGKLHADIKPIGDPPCFASLQAGSYRADAAAVGSAAAPVERVDVNLSAEQVRMRPQEPFQEAEGAVDLSAAPVIVSVGRGIKDPENIPLAEALAKALGGELGASRPICDSGWLPLERQIGSSGQTVSPKLYVALGISGAIQHVVGMKGSRTIVAINKDRGAPIFEIADYGIVGDLFEVVPALTEAIQEIKKS